MPTKLVAVLVLLPCPTVSEVCCKAGKKALKMAALVILPWHALSPSTGQTWSDGRSCCTALMQHRPLNSSHFIQSFGHRIFAKTFVWAFCRMKSKRSNCEKKNIFARWVSIITSEAIFLCVNCLSIKIPPKPNKTNPKRKNYFGIVAEEISYFL